MSIDAPIEASSGHRSLLADGTAVLIRRLGPADRAAVLRLHAELPADDRYLRFFSAGAGGFDRLADLVVSEASVAVGAFRSDELVGVAHYRREAPGTAPEVAAAVRHDLQHRGVATLLIEYLVAVARSEGVTRLDAEVLAVNQTMAAVLRDLGLPLRSTPFADMHAVELGLPDAGTTSASERYAAAMLDRSIRSDVASLRAVLAPRSVVVVGVGSRPRSVGRLVLRQLVEGGFTGTVDVVSRHRSAVGGVRVHERIEDVPEGIDLAVVCVPAAAVPDVARRCGERGTRSLLVITSGVSSDPRLRAELTSAVARFGMRLVGPNCIGVVNTDAAVRLQATFGTPGSPGHVGLAVQSGGVAIALTAELNRLGLGVSTAVSTGDALDVNGDDLLAWWDADERTTAGVLYLESLGRPRLFARLARRVAAGKPVLTVRSGSSAAARRAAASHTAGSATPRVLRDALFDQAGVLAVDEFAELPALLALLSWQPLPRGRRVAVVSNAGGAGVLAADACARAGLAVNALSAASREALAALLPAGASVTNPVDVTATAPPASCASVLRHLLADDEVDAVVAITVPTAVGDPFDDTALPAGPLAKPLVLVRFGGSVTVARRDQAQMTVPEYASASVAARALAAAARRTEWLRVDRAPVPEPAGVRLDHAHVVVDAALDAEPDGGWLTPEQAVALSAAAGLPIVDTTVVHSAAAAVRAWRELGTAVALKADVEGVLHKSAAGAVRTGLASRAQIVGAVRDFRLRFGPRLRGVLVQPMSAAGLEFLVGITADPVVGPMLTVGLGGTTTDLVDDRAHCLVPPTETDLDQILAHLRAGPRLLDRADAAQLQERVRDVAARLAWLADRFPEIVEAEVNPLVVTADSAVAVDVRIRVAPVAACDQMVRELPS